MTWQNRNERNSYDFGLNSVTRVHPKGALRCVLQKKSMIAEEKALGGDARIRERNRSESTVTTVFSIILVS